MLRRALLLAPLAVLGFAPVADAKSSGGTGYPPRRGSGGFGILILIGAAMLVGLFEGPGGGPKRRFRRKAKRIKALSVAAPPQRDNRRKTPYLGAPPLDRGSS